jgi:Ca2+/Na+ antiporter
VWLAFVAVVCFIFVVIIYIIITTMNITGFSLIALLIIVFVFVIFFYKGDKKPQSETKLKATQSQTDVANKLLGVAEAGEVTSSITSAGTSKGNVMTPIRTATTQTDVTV